MSVITLDKAEQDAAAMLDSVLRQIADFRQELETYRDEVRSGEEGKMKEARAHLRDLGQLIINCQNAENRLYDCRARRAGIAQGEYAFDFDQVREEVQCALARVAACCSAGDVSG